MKRFILEEPHFIGGALLAAGSVVTEDDFGSYVDPEDDEEKQVKAGRGLIEIDSKGQPVHKRDIARLQLLGVSAAPIEVAPVSPHAPNPTAPQALPPHAIGETPSPGHYVPADGVESDEAAAARDQQQAATTPQRRRR